jgi:hypothetical protein
MELRVVEWSGAVSLVLGTVYTLRTTACRPVARQRLEISNYTTTDAK